MLKNTIKSGINSTILIKDLIASQFIMKVKSSGVKINTNFNGDIFPKRVLIMCISVIVIDSVCKVNKSYFPKLFLEECRYKVKVTMKAVTPLMT